MKKILSITTILVLTFILAACGDDKEKITVVLDWTPNTNHTGLYVALDKGYYADLGLDVEIIQPPQTGADAAVASGAADFGVSYQEGVTFARAAGTPIVSIAAIIQHNTSGFAALATEGIETPADFEGKSYGGWGSDIERATIKALMDEYDADIDQVDMVTVGSYSLMNPGELDFFWVYEAWDIIDVQLNNVNYDYISLREVNEDLDYYTPVLITSETMIEKDSDTVSKFVEATKKGYEYAIDNSADSAEILLEYAPELSRDLVIASQEYLADKYQDDAEVWGIQEEVVWERYMKWLVDKQLLEDEIDVTTAYTNDYITE